jgi:hypothetical protein
MSNKINDIKNGAQEALDAQFAEIDASGATADVAITLKLQAQLEMDKIVYETESALIKADGDGYKTAMGNTRA